VGGQSSMGRRLVGLRERLSEDGGCWARPGVRGCLSALSCSTARPVQLSICLAQPAAAFDPGAGRSGRGADDRVSAWERTGLVAFGHHTSYLQVSSRPRVVSRQLFCGAESRCGEVRWMRLVADPLVSCLARGWKCRGRPLGREGGGRSEQNQKKVRRVRGARGCGSKRGVRGESARASGSSSASWQH